MRLSAVPLLLCALSTARAERVQSAIEAPQPQIAFSDWRLIRQEKQTLIYSTAFPSSVVTPYAEDNIVPLEAYLPAHAAGPMPVVLVLHYWGADDHRVELAIGEQLNAKGIAAVAIALPYHMQRTPAGFASGELAVVADTDRLVQTMTQSVLDSRRAIDFIVSRPEFDAHRIGIAGTSLGAVVASLVYGVEPRIGHAAFMLGGVDLADIVWHSSRVVQQREEFRKQGITESQLRTALQSVEPSNYLSKRRDDNAYVVAARFDTVVPRKATEELIAALGHPKTLWLETGHYGGIFVKQRLLDSVSGFFAASFANQPFEAPSSIFVPTLRLGAQVVSGTGFDVGVGIDLFHTYEDREFFGTAFLTPRGPIFFVGKLVDQGFAVGASVSPKRLGFGVFWSTVF